MAAASGIVVWNAVSKHATAGTEGSAAVTASSAASDLGWCSGARSVSAPSRSRTSGVTRTGAVYLVPPCTIRCPAAPTGPKDPIAFSIVAVPAVPSLPSPTAGRSAPATTLASSSRTRSFRLLDPALTTRTRLSSSISSP